jgi:hypothetical protein
MLKKMILIAVIVLGIGFSYGCSEISVSKTYTENLDGINNIKIESDTVEIEVKSTSEKDLKVDYKGEVTSSKKDFDLKCEINKSGDEIKIVPQELSSGNGFVVKDDLKVYAYIPDSYGGNLTINSEDGHMKLENVNYGVDVKSDTGNLELTCSEINKSINIDDVDGNIELLLAENSEFSINIETTDGSVKNDFPLKLSRSGEKNYSGVYKSSKNKIKIKTDTGNIKIDKN